MDEPTRIQAAEEIEVIERMSSRICAGDFPGQIEIERALESGFGRLISMEAELDRTRRLPPPRPDTAALEEQIGLLTATLTRLRTLSTPAGQSRLGFGFVFAKGN